MEKYELDYYVTLSDISAVEEMLLDGEFGTYDPEEIDELIEDLANTLSFDSHTDRVLFKDGLRKGVILNYMRYSNGFER